MEMAFVVALLLILFPVVSSYEKNNNDSLKTGKEYNVERVGKRQGQGGMSSINLKATKLTTIEEFKVQVDLEWTWGGSDEDKSYILVTREHEGPVKAKYPIKVPRKTSIFLYPFYRSIEISVSIEGSESNKIDFSKPNEPYHLQLIRIDLNKKDKTKRDFEFTWNSYQAENPLTNVFRSWFKRRERKFDLIDGYTLWETVNQPVAQGNANRMWSSRVVLTALPDIDCEFTVVSENKMGFSNYSGIITVDGPELPPTNLTLVQISISDSDTGKDNKRNFHFEFFNNEYQKINKLRQILFEIRIGKDNYTKTWGPWQNLTPVDFGPDAKNASIVLPDYPTYEIPAIQFRALSIAYVGTSKNFSNIVTVVRPSKPPENLTLVGITRSFEDKEDVNKRDFDFVIDNHFYPINKIIRLRFQYRIYRLVNFQRNTTEKWQQFDPDVDIDSGRLHARATITNIMTSDVYDQYLKIEFRAMAIGYVGVSDPSNIVFADVPGNPHRMNYIYYGIDVECYTKVKCKMELDFWGSHYNGTFEILEYIIQNKYYSTADKKWNWKTDTIAPENWLHYKRQLITFNYYNSYRVCARNVFGVSLPSNVLFDSSNRFKVYALNVSYARHPNDTKALNLQLFWEPFTNLNIHNYIVQSNLFFEHDTRRMRNEVSVPWNVTTVEYKKKIKFTRYENEKGSARGFYLPEFRVISRRKDKTFVASSATTITHFSYEEYKDKGDELCGCMPVRKLIVEPGG